MFIGGASGGASADIRWICEVCGRGSCVSPLVGEGEEEEEEGRD